MKKLFSIALGVLFAFTGFGQEYIDFTYSLKRTSKDSKIIQVNGHLKNTGDKTVYFLSESCNGLDYYLSSESGKTSPHVLIFCFASMPVKNELKPGETFSFSSKLKLNQDTSTLALTIMFVELKEDENLDSKSIQQIQREYKTSTRIIKGKQVEIVRKN